MTDTLKLLAILAHPDDEALGNGGILAKYAAEGIETHLITATRGEYGWPGDSRLYPGPQALGNLRETELQSAAEVLGLHSVAFLNYLDGELDAVHPAEVIAKIVGHLRRIRPDVVVTFGPYGSYGHPDHIAISQFTAAALIEAASPASTYYQELSPHRVAKLYYMAETQAVFAVYQSVFGTLAMNIDGVDRRSVAWPDWSVTTRIDTRKYYSTILRAIACHRSQLPAYQVLEHLSDEQRAALWADAGYYRALSLVNGGRRIETDLFEGLR